MEISRLIVFALASVVLNTSCNDYSVGYDKSELFILNEDVYIEGIGTLDSGAVIRYERGFDEGFTRFSLLLNIPMDMSMNKLVDSLSQEEITHPYWLVKRSQKEERLRKENSAQ